VTRSARLVPVDRQIFIEEDLSAYELDGLTRSSRVLHLLSSAQRKIACEYEEYGGAASDQVLSQE
jgi:hypothetical protein